MDCTALLADIHGNSPALRAVLTDIERAGCSRLFILGDIINGLDPAACVDLLQTWPGQIQAIRGNAEMYLLTPDLDSFPKKHEPNYAPLIRLLHWYEQRLSTEHLSWLGNLPDIIHWEDACLAHDSPLDRLFPEYHSLPGIDNKYQELTFHSPGLYSNTPYRKLEPILNWMDRDGISEIYIAHTHMPFIAYHGSHLICNVGSVGLPLDGDPRAAWVQVDSSPGKHPVVSIRRVAYNINEILDMADSRTDYPDFDKPGMQQAYKRMLQTGIHWHIYI